MDKLLVTKALSLKIFNCSTFNAASENCAIVSNNALTKKVEFPALDCSSRASPFILTESSEEIEFDFETILFSQTSIAFL